MHVDRKQRTLLILFIWLLASLSGMHGHYCFDGQEPPFSVHFHLLDSHEHGDAEAGHKDFDGKPMEMTVLKWLSADLPFLAATLLLLVIWPRVREPYFRYLTLPSTWLTITGLRPPARAPPLYSH